jgi:hypothetical protein
MHKLKPYFIFAVVAMALLWGTYGVSADNCNVGDSSAWGRLSGPGDSCAFSLYSYVQTLSVFFSAPGRGTDFWVEVVGEDGRTVLGNWNINDSLTITLSGGGTFYVTVYSNRGAGNWSCSW